MKIKQKNIYGTIYYFIKNKGDGSPQEYMFERAKEQEHTFYIRYESNGNNYYGSYKNANDFIKIYEKIPEKNKTFHELLHKDMPKKAYFDIDYYGQEDLTKEIIKEIKEYFKEILKINIKKREIEVCDSSGPDGDNLINKTRKIKRSYHILINNGIYFRNAEDIKICMKDFIEKLKKKENNKLFIMDDLKKNDRKLVIDQQVYSNNRCIRLIYSRKKERVLIPVTSKEIKNHLISNIETDKIKYYKVKKISSNIDKKIKNNIEKMSELINDNNILKLDQILEENIIERFTKLHPDVTYEKYINDDNIFTFIFSKSKYECQISKRVHKNNRNYLTYNMDTGRIRYKCHDEECSQYPQVLFDKRINNIEWNEVYCEEKKMKPYHIPDEYNTLCIKSNMGNGKTVALEEYIKKIPKDKSILIISYRVVLCDMYIERFKKYGFESYNNNVISSNRVIFCLDSIYKLLFEYEYQYEKFDYVIIDELDSVITHIHSPLIKNKSLVIEAFKYHTMVCNTMICLDANIDTTKCFQVIDEIRDMKKTYWVHNNYKWETNKEVYFSDDNTIEIELNNSLENKEKIVCVCSSKKQTEKLFNKINEIDFYKNKIIIYNSDNKLNTNEVTNVNELWKNINCVIYSPTISAGISYEITNINGFDTLFGYLVNSYNCPDVMSITQMLFRVRNLNIGKMYVTDIGDKDEYKIVDINTISYNLENKCNYIWNIINTDGCNLTFENNKIKLNDFNGLIYGLNIKTKMESFYNFKSILIKQLEQMGIPHKTHRINEEIIIDNKIGETIDKKEMILNAENITELKYLKIDEKIKHDEKYTEKERYEWEKYRLALEYDINIMLIDKTFIDKYYDPQKRIIKKYRRYELLSDVIKIDEYRKQKEDEIKTNIKESNIYDLSKTISADNNKLFAGIKFADALSITYDNYKEKTLTKEDYKTAHNILKEWLQKYKKSIFKMYELSVPRDINDEKYIDVSFIRNCHNILEKTFGFQFERKQIKKKKERYSTYQISNIFNDIILYKIET